MGEQISNGCSALDWEKERAALQQVDTGEGGGNGKEGRGSAGLVVSSVAIFKLLSKFFIILNFKNSFFLN